MAYGYGYGYGRNRDEAGTTPAPGAPFMFSHSQWELVAKDGEYSIRILSLPSDNGSAITDIEFREDGGSWMSLGTTIPGDYDQSPRDNDVEYTVEIRAVNAIGAGLASDPKNVTPTANLEGAPMGLLLSLTNN